MLFEKRRPIHCTHSPEISTICQPLQQVLFQLHSTMNAVKFSQTEGPVGLEAQKTSFSQVVSLPASSRIVITAGQPGFDLKTGLLVETSVEDQISAAFDCVDAALKSAGIKDGLASVHKIASYFKNLGHEPVMMEIWRRRYPDVRPTWTAVGVASLVTEGMVVEIQGEATIL